MEPSKVRSVARKSISWRTFPFADDSVCSHFARDARRVALAAQGFDAKHGTTAATWSAMSREIARLHLLQIDSVNVITRSHYLPLFSRLENYGRAALDEGCLSNRKRHLFECWAHEASPVPLPLHPLMRWRMHRAQHGNGYYTRMDRFGREEKAFLKRTLEYIEKTGPIHSSQVPGAGKSAGGGGGGPRASSLSKHRRNGKLSNTSSRSQQRRWASEQKLISETTSDSPSKTLVRLLQIALTPN